jgi:hypothetical protein
VYQSAIGFIKRKGVEFVDLAPDVMLSSILEKHSKESLSMIFDSLTDLALSAD